MTSPAPRSGHNFMPRPIVLDATHLVTRLSQPATTGIDRVDLAYARHFAGQDPRVVAGTQYGLFRPHLLSIARMRSLIEHFERRQLERDCGHNPEWQALRERLQDRSPPLTP